MSGRVMGAPLFASPVLRLLTDGAHGMKRPARGLLLEISHREGVCGKRSLGSAEPPKVSLEQQGTSPFRKYGAVSHRSPEVSPAPRVPTALAVCLESSSSSAWG